MSKRRNGRKIIDRIARQVRRDASRIARRSLPELSSVFNRPYRLRPFEVLNHVQDNRLFHPDTDRPLLSRSGSRSRLVVASAPSRGAALPARLNFPSPRVVFQVPERTLVCLRRSRRKEVIHALGVAGSRVARPRRNANSKLHCK